METRMRAMGLLSSWPFILSNRRHIDAPSVRQLEITADVLLANVRQGCREEFSRHLTQIAVRSKCVIGYYL